MLKKSTFKVTLLFVSACLLMLVLVFPNASSASSNDQFLNGSWAFQIAEFPNVETYCQYTSNLVGSSVSGNINCSPGYVPIPTDDGLLVLDSKSLGTWARIGDSQFEMRMERDVNNADLFPLPGLKFVDWGVLNVSGDTLTGTVQGAVMDLEGNIIIPLPPLTLSANRITSSPPDSN